MLHYELGTHFHGRDSKRANQHYLNALKVCHASVPNSPKELLRHQAQSELIRLMIANSEAGENQQCLQRTATVRQLGRLIVENCTLVYKSPDREMGSQLYGRLVETAFMGVLLIPPHAEIREIGLPTTRRQDAPHHKRKLSYKSAIAGIQTVSATDINLYRYEGDALSPISGERLQVKTKYRDEDEAKYDDDILVVFADRDLFIERTGELKAFGQSLASYRGEPDRTLEIARSNIDLAYELHTAQYQS